jgi:hypothetical protein
MGGVAKEYITKLGLDVKNILSITGDAQIYRGC